MSLPTPFPWQWWRRGKDALLRFPLAMLCSVGSMTFLVLYFQDPESASAPMRYRTALSFLLGVPLFTFVALVSEAAVGRSRFAGFYLASAGLLALEVLRFSFSSVPGPTVFPRVLQLAAGLFFLLALVPVFFRAPSEGVISFSRVVLGRAVKAAGVFGLGALVIYFGILLTCSLLRMPFQWVYFERILLQVLFVGVTWYFLAGIPASFGGTPTSWNAIRNVVLGPRGFWLPFALSALCVLLLGVRLGERALDLPNYFLVLVGLWALGSGAYLKLAEVRNLRFPAVALSLLTILSSFGPWSAYSLVESSQLGDLEARLERLGVLREGRLEKPQRAPTASELQQIESRIEYVNGLFGYLTLHRMIWPGLKERGVASERNDGNRDNTRVLMRLLGLESSSGTYVSFQGARNQPLDVAGWHVFLPLSSHSVLTRRSVMWKGRNYEVTWDATSDALQFTRDGKLLGEVRITPVLERLASQPERLVLPVSETAFRIAGKWKELEVQVDFANLTAKKADENRMEPVSFKSYILMRFASS